MLAPHLSRDELLARVRRWWKGEQERGIAPADVELTDTQCAIVLGWMTLREMDGRNAAGETLH